MNKFSFSPGLPGYGSRGVDGSSGGQGVSIYFSTFVGTSDSVTLNSRITNNLDLQTAGAALPDGRAYVTGDSFIDSVGKVFNINIAGGLTYGKYEYSGSQLSTSAEFDDSGLDTTGGFNRFVNDWVSAKKIYDQVYTINPGNPYSTALAGSLYIDITQDFSRINYCDYDINSYYPYQAWIAGIDEDGIGLVRESAANNWHLGNLDDSDVQRAINLTLDFTKVSMLDASIKGDSTFADSSFNGIVTFNAANTFNNTNTFNGINTFNANNIFNNSILLNDASLALNNSFIYFLTDSSLIGKRGVDSVTTPTNGATFNILAGRGGDTTGLITGAIGGNISITAGDGGDSESTSTNDIGLGGNIVITAGIAGTIDDTPSSDRDAMGYIHLKTGELGSDEAIPSGGDIILDATESPVGVTSDRKGKIRIYGSENEIYGYSSKTNVYSRLKWNDDGDLTIDSSGFQSGVGGVVPRVILGGSDSSISFVIDGKGIIDASNADEGTGRGVKFICTGAPAAYKTAMGMALTGFNVLGGYSTGFAAGFRNFPDSSPSTAKGINIWCGSADNQASGTYDYLVAYTNDFTSVGELSNVNGTFQVVDSSDERLKMGIKNSKVNALEAVNSIPIREFFWRNRDASGNILDTSVGIKRIGYIAQETEPYIPAAVIKKDDGYLSIGAREIIPILHKAIQELSEENNELKDRVSILENLVNQLIAKVDPTIS